jgi:hypothetical protein
MRALFKWTGSALLVASLFFMGRACPAQLAATSAFADQPSPNVSASLSATSNTPSGSSSTRRLSRSSIQLPSGSLPSGASISMLLASPSLRNRLLSEGTGFAASTSSISRAHTTSRASIRLSGPTSAFTLGRSSDFASSPHSSWVGTSSTTNPPLFSGLLSHQQRALKGTATKQSAGRSSRRRSSASRGSSTLSKLLGRSSSH